MKNFRLREFRESLGLSQKDFASVFNLSKSTYNNYETGVREINSDLLTKIANKYDVTVDYLIGRTDEPHPQQKKPADGGHDKYAVQVAQIMEGLTEEQKQQVIDYAKLHEAARNKPKEQK